MEVKPIDDLLTVYDAAGNETTAIKNLWRGCAAFLCGGGPSIKSLPYHQLAERGICSLGINNIAGMVPVKAFTFNDPPEKFHDAIWRDPGIMKFCPKPKLSNGHKGKVRQKLPDGSFKYTQLKTPQCPNVWAYERCDYYTPETFFTCFNYVNRDGVSRNLPAATFGNNDAGVQKTGRPKIICSLFLGLRLLHYLGVRRVYLLGVDFWMDPAKSEVKIGNYAFDEIRDAGNVRSCNDLFAVAAKMCDELRPVFDAAGFGVFNCNQWSRLRAFDYVPFDQALEDCRNGVPSGPLDLQGWYQKGEYSDK